MKDSTRGTRLPEDWKPDEKLLEWTATYRPDLSTVDIELLTGQFVDYWLSEPGKKGLKANWNSTYRNWMRRADISRYPKTGRAARFVY